MDLTPDNALVLLTAPPSQLRDTLRRTFLQEQNMEELIYWVGACAQELGRRRGWTEAQALATLARLAGEEDIAAEQAATS